MKTGPVAAEARRAALHRTGRALLYAILCAAFLVSPCWSQTPDRQQSTAIAAPQSAPPLAPVKAIPVRAIPVRAIPVRAIEDPATAEMWVLEPGASHSGGPGRLVLAGRDLIGASRSERGRAGWEPSLTAREPLPGGSNRAILRSNESTQAEHFALLPSFMNPTVIRAGDPVLLVAHTAVMDARLEAVALEPAAVGSVFRVRLRIGGKAGQRVLDAVALGPGRARWNPANGARP